MNISNQTLEVCKQLLSEGYSIELVLKKLRDYGCSKGQSISTILKMTSYSLRQAKIIVHFSKTWRDQRISDEEFHESLIQSLSVGRDNVDAHTHTLDEETVEALRAVGLNKFPIE